MQLRFDWTDCNNWLRNTVIYNVILYICAYLYSIHEYSHKYSLVEIYIVLL
jgi:hypothetical protein